MAYTYMNEVVVSEIRKCLHVLIAEDNLVNQKQLTIKNTVNVEKN